MASSEDEEFYDCQNINSPHSLQLNGAIKKNGSKNNKMEFANQNNCISLNNNKINNDLSVWGGRCRLPATMCSKADFSLWSFLKQCIGKELSKITMPIVFNEPLSFLQRIVEYMEYANIIRQASECDDPVKRLELVTAFAVSATASNWERLGKPFNPLLGETYELDRPDLGYRIVCEQVSHHPPISAFYVESDIFTFHGSIHPKLKFWGKSVEVTPKGLVTLCLKKYNEAYSWQNVNCCVHNVIVGKIWIEHYGAMEVVNHSTGWKSTLNFHSCGWFGKDLHKIDGHMFDEKKRKIRSFYGKWVDSFYSFDVDDWMDYIEQSEEYNKNPTTFTKDRQNPDTQMSKTTLTKSNSLPSYETDSNDDLVKTIVPCNLGLRTQELLWAAMSKPDDANLYYSFTLFAMMLNELTGSKNSNFAPTDSRYRPDIRLMEEGKIGDASVEKNRIEEKQRMARKDRKKKKVPTATLR